jgi:hypothetical protein
VPKHVFLEVTGRDGAPNLRAHFAWRDGRPQTVELTIAATADGRALRQGDIDQLNVDGFARAWFAEHTLVIEEETATTMTSAAVDWSDPRWHRDFWELEGSLSKAQAAPGRAAQLERVAQVYRASVGKGVVPAVAVALGVSPRTAARRIVAARRAGLLDDRDE